MDISSSMLEQMEIRLRKLTSSMPGLNLVQIYDKSCVCCLINLHMINFNEIFICKFWNLSLNYAIKVHDSLSYQSLY